AVRMVRAPAAGGGEKANHEVNGDADGKRSDSRGLLELVDPARDKSVIGVAGPQLVEWIEFLGHAPSSSRECYVKVTLERLTIPRAVGDGEGEAPAEPDTQEARQEPRPPDKATTHGIVSRSSMPDAGADCNAV